MGSTSSSAGATLAARGSWTSPPAPALRRRSLTRPVSRSRRLRAFIQPPLGIQCIEARSREAAPIVASAPRPGPRAGRIAVREHARRRFGAPAPGQGRPSGLSAVAVSRRCRPKWRNGRRSGFKIRRGNPSCEFESHLRHWEHHRGTAHRGTASCARTAPSDACPSPGSASDPPRSADPTSAYPMRATLPRARQTTTTSSSS